MTQSGKLCAPPSMHRALILPTGNQFLVGISGVTVVNKAMGRLGFLIVMRVPAHYQMYLVLMAISSLPTRLSNISIHLLRKALELTKH